MKGEKEKTNKMRATWVSKKEEKRITKTTLDLYVLLQLYSQTLNSINHPIKFTEFYD